MVIMMVLARLLTPEDFGLIAIVTVFFAIADGIIESGFGQAYVQKAKVSDIDADTVFYINLAISLLIYGIFWFAAPIISKFYDQPKLIVLMRVMSLVLIINAFKIIQIAQLTRLIDFKKKTKATVLAGIISGIFGVSAALYGMGVWSLVILQLSRRFFITTILWITSKWRPHWQFSFTSCKELFSFGGWILLSGLVQKLLRNINTLLIGKFFPLVQLGFYSTANRFVSLGINELSRAITTVTFPVFSQMQDDKKTLANSMLKVIKTNLLLVVPVGITVIVLAKPFVLLLLTEKWAPMIPYLQLLCVEIIIAPILGINQQIFKARGKSRLSFNIGLFFAGMNLLNIFITYRWGIIYMIIGKVSLSYVFLSVYTYFTKKLIGIGLIKQLNEVKEIFLGAVFAGFLSYILINNIGNLYLQLCIGGLLSVLLFLLTQYLFNRKFIIETLELRHYLKIK
jgi:O-antigen/teichoic acid export membrane protein